MNPMPPTNPRFAATASPHHAGQSQAAGTAWSSSPNANNSDNAWNVNFNNGNDNNDNKNNANRVRLVRSGEWSADAPACALSFHDLYVAWQSARQRKRPSHNQLTFESQWLDSLVELQERVNTGAWWPSPPVCFVTTRPKAREIHAPDFSDRVLHHWLVPRLEPLFEPVFVHDSFSNRQGKGTLRPCSGYSSTCVVCAMVRAKATRTTCSSIFITSLTASIGLRCTACSSTPSNAAAKRLRSHKPDIKTGHVNDGVDFLGYVVHPKHLTVRPRVLRHVHERLTQLQSELDLARLRATVASYWGHLAHARAHKARRSLCKAFPWLMLWFEQPERPNPVWRTPPKAPRSLTDQLAWLRAQFPKTTLRVQQGLGRVVLLGSKQQVWVHETGQLESGLRQRVVVGGRSTQGANRYSIFARRKTI